MMARKLQTGGETDYKWLMDKAADGIIIYRNDNTFAYINPAACRLLGYSRQEIMKKQVQDFLLPAEKKRLEVVKVERRRGDKRLVEWRAIRRDGSLVDVEAKTTFLEDTQQWISFIRDITERKKMEAQIHQAEIKQQILKTKAELLEKQRRDLLELNKAKDEFITIASHQLRTPATSVKQYTGMILEGYFGALNDDQRQMLQTAYNANELQMQVVNNLILAAQFETGQAKAIHYPQDMVKCVHELLAEINHVLEQRKQTVVVKLPRSCKAISDASLLKVALGHVIRNASQYSSEGTPITIELIRKNKHAVITVTDHGVGIRKQDQKLLFRKFTRIPNPLTDTVNGNGLGLYLAKQIIDLLKGDIVIDSRPGKGTVFTMRVPLHP